MIHRNTSPLKHASIIFGAFFCLWLSACGEKKTTPDWQNEPTQLDAKALEASKETSATQLNTGTKGEAVRFLAYNLKNYLKIRRYVDGKSDYRSKPEDEISALIDVIRKAQPHILGVCEIGTDEDLKDFQLRLKKSEIDLPHTRRAYGFDTVRSLAILSRYPILSWKLPKKMTYQLGGKPFKISRGILDVTIQLPDKKVRFLGVHFKSKRPIAEADQELMRRNESILLRKHIDDILKKHPDTLLMAYGDFNDTTRAKAVYTVKGRSNSRNHMEMLDLADSRGENWTHNWKREDIYSRFDYVMVNKKLSPFIHREASLVLDPDNWAKASDHRPLLVLIK